MTKDDSFPNLSDDLRQELKKDRDVDKKHKRIAYPLTSLLLISLFVLGLWKISFTKDLNLSNQSATSLPKVQNTPKLTPTPSTTPSSEPSPAPTPAPSPSTETYTVVDGDTLSSIAKKFGVPTESLARENGLTEPYFLSIGDKLVIPK